MKVTLLSLLVTMISAVSMAQSSKEVKWAFTSKKIADKTYEVRMTATVNNGWHIYSQKVGVDGPIPTAFTFTKNPLVVLEHLVLELHHTASANLAAFC